MSVVTADRPPKVRIRAASSLFEPAIVRRALGEAFVKLDPRTMIRNPVMFMVEIGSVVTTVEFAGRPSLFVGLVTLWLWATVLFANFAEAVAEGRGKAQADTLRRSRKETVAYLLQPRRHAREEIPSTELRAGDLVVVTAGQVIPGDGDVIEGIAVVDESAITGESAPVIRESGGDRSRGDRRHRRAVRPDRGPDHLQPGRDVPGPDDRPGRGGDRQKTPNEIALDILIAGLTLILLVAVVTLQPMAIYDKAIQSTAVLVALFVCLAPTTIGGLLSAIGIAGMDRMVQRNVLAMSGRAVEAAGDCSTLLLDKTGTITYGNRMAAEFIPVGGVTETELAEAALLSQPGRRDARGPLHRRASPRNGQARRRARPDRRRARPVHRADPDERHRPGRAGSIRKGAADSVRRWVDRATGGSIPDDLAPIVERIAQSGGTPLVVADGTRVLGVIYLKDTVKPGMPERFAQLRDMGIRTVMITGDNPLTAKAIAAEAGVDDFLAEATPEEKLALIRREQRGGHMVAMTGDGTNDAPALAQADVGLAMNTGTQAAKEAGNMVDLDSNPTKLIEVVEVAKQLLITRGSLTTFSIANDVAKYFAIIPAMFVVVYPELRVLNVMHLNNPHTAILSAVIYNALIIPALIPLALRGVKFQPRDGAAILRRNTLIYGVGGIIAPFVFIKLIDLILTATGLH